MACVQKCPVCQAVLLREPASNSHSFRKFYECPTCGRFEIESTDRLNLNYLAPYLLYNRFESDNCSEYRYHTTLSKEACDEYIRQAEESGDYRNGRPTHLDNDLISAWYPHSFSERINKILLYIADKTPHVGQDILFPADDVISMLFVDRWENQSNAQSMTTDKASIRDDESCNSEALYMLNYLQDAGFINWTSSPYDEGGVIISLSPLGYTRVDELQKYSSHGRNALVAMQFGKETMELREAIRKGIADAGYYAIFIDEVQHNDFITPELLKYIRDSKFVVVDLTHKNNGAYFEEGYALGVGKPVIQLCKKGTQLHFDIAQKNTIMWESEDAIPLALTNRIKATVE